EISPNKTALFYHNEQLTYDELNKKSNQLAHYLVNKEVKENDIIGISSETGLDMLIAILGILKVGAAYLPISPSLPEERAQLMIQEAKPKLILKRGQHSFIHKVETIDLLDSNEIINQPITNPNITIQPSTLAYVIFTSGSTGVPKGVQVEHANLTSLIHALMQKFDIDNSEKVLLFSDYGFDASVEQIWLALCNGAKLVLVNEDMRLNIDAFENLLAKEEITHLHATPAFLEQITPSSFGGLKRVIAGGDVCNWDLANNWYAHCDFFNEYGPTETTVTSLINQVNPSQKAISLTVPIG
ncbi:AMP-binding protein, partial [Fulvivirga sp. 29W222]